MMNLVRYFLLIILLGLKAESASADNPPPLPSRCETYIPSLPGDPHEMVYGRRVQFNKYTHQATISHYATRALNLGEPADLFKSGYLTESLFYTFERDESTGIVTILSAMNQTVGKLEQRGGEFFWLEVGDEAQPETVVCN